MSKVISFSISDRYLDKLRSLYPSLTDNLAAKQFITDGLDSSLSNSLDGSLDAGLDDKVKTLIETWVDGLLDERLDDAVKKSITSLSERMARLEERLDDSLDGKLDAMEQLLKLQREALIADHSPIPPGETSPLPPSPDEQGTDAIETIEETDSTVEDADTVETANEPDSSIELDKGALETVTGKTSPMIEPEPALETVTGETSKTSKGLNPTEAYNYLISQGIKAAPARRTLNDWVKQGKISGTSPQGKKTLKHLTLRDGLYYPIN